MAKKTVPDERPSDQTANLRAVLNFDIGLGAYVHIQEKEFSGDVEACAEEFLDYAENILLVTRWTDRNVVGSEQINVAISAARHFVELSQALTSAYKALTALQGGAA
jgi:hypothetical protein